MLRVSFTVPASASAIRAVLQGLVEWNRLYLAGGKFPPLYRSGVRYRRESGTENWQPVTKIYAAGYGDCEDLAAWRVAELRELGEPADVHIKRTGKSRFHAMVRRADGSLEDPSKILGPRRP